MRQLVPIFLLFVFTISSLNAQEYRVQLAAYANEAPFTQFAFAGITDVYKNVDQNTFHRYYLGKSFKTVGQAEMIRKEIVKRGFPNAQIVDMVREKTLCGTSSPFSSMGTIYSNMSTENLYLRTIFFGFDKSSLSVEAMKKLNELSLILENNEYLKAFIIGHTDGKGNPEYNAILSKHRARQAKNYLVSKGISAKRIQAKACGESRPVAINRAIDGEDSPEGRHFNRRVTIAVVNQKGEVINDLVRKSDVPGHLQVNKQILHQQLMHAQAEK